MEEWVKQTIFLYLIMHALTQLAAKEAYRKYIQFFCGTCFLLYFMTPVLNYLLGDTTVFEEVEQFHYQQELEEWQTDMDKMEYLQTSYCVEEYAESLEGQIAESLEEQGYVATKTDVSLNQSYEIQQVTVCARVENMGDGLTQEEQNTRQEELKQQIMEKYGLEDGVVEVELERTISSG